MPRNSLTRKQWAARITKQWHGGTGTMIDAIIAVARDLEQAQEEIGYSEYMLMFEKGEVPFGYKKGNMFIRIADSPKISEFHHDGILPPDWNTLYLLTRLGKEKCSAIVERLLNGCVN
jgi:hypothetical protein